MSSPNLSVHPDEVAAQPPLEASPARLTARSRTAAGWGGVEHAMADALEEMGVTRSFKTLLKLNQKNGFDCQSCAWPSPDEHRKVAEFCENGVKAVASEATRQRVTPGFFRRYSVAKLSEKSDYWLNKQGRLTEPMVLRPGAEHYEPIGWPDAFALVARELNALASPDEATFYTSGRTSNEAAFLYQLFVRGFGTNNLPDCSNMCHESSGAALSATLGNGKGSVTLADFDQTDAIFLIGQNPGTNHPRMLTSLRAAKEYGARIVSINPLPEIGSEWFNDPQDLKNPLKAPRVFFGKGTKLSDLWLPVRLNGDMAALQGIMKEMLEAEDANPGGIFDHEFILRYTAGYNELIAHLRQLAWTDLIAASGLTRDQLRAAAQIAMNSKATIICWAMGLTQAPQAVETIQEIVNLLLLRGNVGQPGTGPCPVRGHSNVQGDRTMGIFDKPSKSLLDRLASTFHFDPPRNHGLDVVDSIRAMADGRVKILFAVGGNLLGSAPDTEFTATALRRCRLTAHVATKLNRSHLVTGEIALILPCLGRSEIDRQAAGEQFVTVEDSMGIINPSRGVLEPASPALRSEPAIIAGLARATLGKRLAVDWEQLAADYDRVRDLIAQVIPNFENFNQRIRENPFYLPHPTRDGRKFPTPQGKALFTVHSVVPTPLEPGQLLMTTIRSHDQFNTTIYGLDDHYRGVFNGRRVVFMNADDISERGLVQGQWVDLTSHFHGQTRTAARFMVAPYPIPRGCTATYFPEANALVPVDSVAAISNTPTSKCVVITVAPTADAFAATADLRRELTG